MLRGLFLGFIRIHILFHAAEAPVFGVALMAELGRHGYQIGPGTLYPILHKLARDGQLSRRPGRREGWRPLGFRAETTRMTKERPHA